MDFIAFIILILHKSKKSFLVLKFFSWFLWNLWNWKKGTHKRVPLNYYLFKISLFTKVRGTLPSITSIMFSATSIDMSLRASSVALPI